MDNLTKDAIAMKRLGYGCHYGAYKVDYPHTADQEEEPEEPEYRKCKECEREFIPDRPNMWYCCEDCRNRRNAREGYQKRKTRKHFKKGPAICPVCGSDFIRKHIYTETCSRTCAALLREQRIREEQTGEQE